VSSFERDIAGQPKARLQFPSDNITAAGNKTGANSTNSAITETGFLGAVQKFNKLMTKTADYAKAWLPQEAVAPVCTPKLSEHMNHVIDFDMSIDPAANAIAVQSLLPLMQAEWVDNPSAAGSARAWHVVKSLPPASMSKKMTAYERALIGNRPTDLPWQANLKIRTSALPATGQEGLMGLPGNALVLNLDFQLLNNEGRSDKFEESITLQIDVERTAWSAPRLSTASMDTVQEKLQALRATAEQWLSCQALNPTVTAVNLEQVQINAGALSGVRKGDEWLLANPAKFPAELIGKEGAPQTLLAKVQSVTPHSAQLLVVAGPAQAVQTNWRAWPTDVLVKEPSMAPNAQHNTTPAKRLVKTTGNSNPAYAASSY
jgi:hypothetical protein